ncbi:MAG: fibrobacter succinogenes major paralogous domain-containing protein [Bacteroidales bacterium]|nr:fibrobacter succinogenes major paralogous domain-containing protein [Bacteroidales bacterium]
MKKLISTIVALTMLTGIGTLWAQQDRVFTVDVSNLNWEQSYILNVMAGSEVIGQIANEFLHKHLPSEINPEVRRRTVVAYPMWMGTIHLQNGFVIDNGNHVSWNLRATLPHEMLTYEAGEAVTNPTTIYIIVEDGEQPRVSATNSTGLTADPTTVVPYRVRDERTGAEIFGRGTTEIEYYGLVKIGTQFWTRDNLRTTRWIDGTPIPTSFAIAAETDWTDALEPGILLGIRGHGQADGAVTNVNVTFADANSTDPTAVALRQRYGVLYNWFAMTRVYDAFLNQEIPASQIVDNISPQGWTVPVRAQFAEMVRYVYNLENVALTGTSNPIPGAVGGRLSGYTLEAYPTPDAVNTVQARPENNNLSGFTAIGNISRSNTPTGFNGNTMFLMMDGYVYRGPGWGGAEQLNRLAQHSMNFFQVETSLDGAHAPGFPGVQSAHRAKYVRIIRDFVCVHVFEFIETVAPTCTEQGFQLYSCIRCDVDDHRAPFEQATGHDFAFEEHVDPTCTEEGFDLYKCSFCGETDERNVVSALGHDYSGSEATCTDPQICPRPGCGVVLVEALGHDWGPIQVEEAPTCTQTGEGYRVCTRCPEEQTGIVLSALTPQNVRSEGAMVFWDAVDFATGYIVEIDGTPQPVVTTNSFDFLPILQEGGTVADVKVRPVFADQDQDRVFIHIGLQVHEFITATVDSIVPVLKSTADLDELLIYIGGNVHSTFLIDDIDSIIFRETGPFAEPCWSDVYTFTTPTTVFRVNIEDLEWADSYVYEIVVGNEVIGHLAYEFLHQHLPGEQWPTIFDRRVVAYTMLNNGRANLSTGLVLINGNFVSWNTSATGATPAHEILISYAEGEEISQPAYLFILEGNPRVTGIEIPNITPTLATLRPMMLRDERTGAPINGETTEVEYYGVVKIGIQYWIRESLRTTRFADGTPILTTDSRNTTGDWPLIMTNPACVVVWAAPGWGAFEGHAAAPGGTGIPGLGATNANSTNEADVLWRNRLGVSYNFQALINTPVAAGTAIPESDIVDRLSPNGWSIPKMDQFAMLVNYVYNINNSGTLNVPTGTGQTHGSIEGANLFEGRLIGYTVENFPGLTGVPTSNITGFGAIGNRGISNTGANNNGTRFLMIDGYSFNAAGAEIQNQHTLMSFQVYSNDGRINPMWRMISTLWAERVRLIMD